MNVVEIKNLYKTYQSGQFKQSLIQNLLFPYRKRDEFVVKPALQDITFHCKKGETVGIIGKNGSGKSTLLKIIGGVTGYNKGHMKVQGRVVSLLEVGAGFSLTLTGRENIYLNGSLLGLTKNEIDEKIEDIIEFSGIRGSIDHPCYQYSSGMYIRLGFSIAAHSNPDILIIDEALSVGDHQFQVKCFETIEKLKSRGKTLLFVSHDLGIIQGICDRVYLLEQGKVKCEGLPQDIVPLYLQSFSGDRAVAQLSLGDTFFTFNNGNLSISRDGNNLTKMYGFYCSALAYQTWHDSDQASWMITTEHEDMITAVASSRRLPLKYRWILKIENQCLKISIFITKSSDFSIENFQASLMLGKKFDHWAIGEHRGSFPQLSEKSIDDWQHLNTLGDQQEAKISASNSEKKCTVTFSHTTKKKYLPSAIVTSKDFNSNVLQFLLIEKNNLHIRSLEETLIFDGEISFT
ncbi:MAG: ABC transporter ATP-binding protein [Bdellovibrionales bacterium]|nr:ABC transporter ATP-binding protein [Bdellovibrionales bacterium]